LFVTLQHIRVNLEHVDVKKVGDEVILDSWSLHKLRLPEQEELLSRRLPSAQKTTLSWQHLQETRSIVVFCAEGSRDSGLLQVLQQLEQSLPPVSLFWVLETDPPSIFFGHSPPTPGTHTSTNREDVRDLKFLLTSRKLHQDSPTSSLHDLDEVKFWDFTSQIH
jgi:hypothetical protein